MRINSSKLRVATTFMLVIVTGVQMMVPSIHARHRSIPQLPIFGAELLMLASKVSDLISQAQAAGQILEIEAGGQILTAIDQAKQAYEKELELTIDRLTVAARNAYNSLRSLVEDFERKAYADARDLARRAAALMHSLPFSKHIPQIFSWTPTYTTQPPTERQLRSRYWRLPSNVLSMSSDDRIRRIADYQRSEDDKIIVSVDGDFYDLPRKDYDATIKFNRCSAVNSTKTNTTVTFEIPKTCLDSLENAVRYNYATVTIPYRKRVFLFFGKKVFSEFKISIITLPRRIGRLEITTTVMVPSVIRQSFKSSERVQRSDDDDIICGGEHADLALHCTPADPGWRIVPSTVGYHMIRSEGDEGNDWYYCGTDHSTLGTACVSFSTRHKNWGTSGKLWFNITYVAEKDVLVAQPETTPIDINWEGMKVFELPNSATWRARFTQFDGRVIEFGGPLSNNPYLKVSQNMNLITFQAIP
jgi:hypothetical protein